MLSLFNIMKYFDNEIEKNQITYQFFNKEKLVKKECGFYVNLITKNFEFYIDVLDIYLSYPFFNKEKKEEILMFKESIIKRKNSIIRLTW